MNIDLNISAIFVNAFIAWTVTQEVIFEPLRFKVTYYADKYEVPKLGYLFTCYHCFGFWMTPISLLITNQLIYLDRIIIVAAGSSVVVTIFHILRQVLKFVMSHATLTNNKVERLEANLASTNAERQYHVSSLIGKIK